MPVPLYPPVRLGRLEEYDGRTEAMLRAVQARLSGGRWVGLFVPLALVALLFSGATVLKSYNSNIRQSGRVQGEAGAEWDSIT